VQVVDGTVTVAGATLRGGDGAGITETDVLDFRFGAESEVLLFDLRMDAPRLWT
jgi:redox-sensitive bicupin YhaK (pirin superfamily)